jgi:hypothetical protein
MILADESNKLIVAYPILNHTVFKYAGWMRLWEIRRRKLI